MAANAKKILIDCDPGVDDTLAVLYALHSPQVQVVAVTTVFGNSSIENTTRNLYSCFDVLEAHQAHLKPTSHGQSFAHDREAEEQTFSRPSIVAGASGPLIARPDGTIVHYEHFHGRGGLGNITVDDIQLIIDTFDHRDPGNHSKPSQPSPPSLFMAGPGSSTAPARSSLAAQATQPSAQQSHSLYQRSDREDAADEILHQLRFHDPQELCLVMLGPLTNLALAIERDGSQLLTLSRVQQVYIMGGCIHHPVVCATHIKSYHAHCTLIYGCVASVVLSSGLPITLVPLDVTETCRLRYGVYRETLVPLAKKAPVPSFVTSFLEHLFGTMATMEENTDSSWYSMTDLDKSRSGHHRQDSGTGHREDHSRLLGLGNEIRAESATFLNWKSRVNSLEDLIESDAKQHIQFTKSTSLAMHDPLCVGIALDPDIVKRTITAPIQVETTFGALTQGMCVVDGRRWKRRRALEEERLEFALSLGGEGPKPVKIVLQADTNRFFESFMKSVFGVVWDADKHSWK